MKKKIQYDQKRINNFTDTKTIDKEIFENEINALRNIVKQEKENLINSTSKQKHSIKEQLELEIKNQTNLHDKIAYAINNQPQIINQNQPQKFIIRLESRQLDYNNIIKFWGKIKIPESDEWYKFEDNHYLSLEFDKIFSFLKPNEEYEIFAQKFYSNKYKTNGGIIHKEFFTNIIELKPRNLLVYQTLYIKLNQQIDYNNKIQYWGKAKKNQFDSWFELKEQDSLSFEFDKNVFNNILLEYQEYKIIGYIRKSVHNKKNGGKIYKRYFEYIENIEQLTKSSSHKTLENLQLQRQNLESTNWIRPLNNKEKEEQNREIEALKKIEDILKKNQQDNVLLVKNLKPTIDKLQKLLNICKDLNIQKDSYFPNSMTFIQNPNYQGSYSFYKQINNMVGIDENLFIQIQIIEKIGLLDIPTIYERWCYLQIIKILIDKYKFQPEENWKINLTNQIIGDSNKIKNLKIQFTNEHIKRKIDLWYEKVLDNGKRPDFILDISSTFGTNSTHNLIMDAKFHEEVDIKKQIELLYKKKNYAENGKNTVFILHPDTNKSIKNKRTPKEWGYDSYYGEVEMFNFKWDTDKNPNHKYGSILLSPINKNGNYLDNLQRLIGMHLQYILENNIEITKENKINPEPSEKIFCLVCGSDSFTGNQFNTSNGKGYRYQLTCNGCKHFYVYNYCWNCKHRLIKNGEYWTYHSNQVLEPFNIKCPNCNQIFVNNYGE